MLAGRTLEEAEFPIKMVGHGHCFRTEAGAGGVGEKGIYRLHQFTKVEMFVACRPEESDAMLEEIVGHQKSLYEALGLDARVLDMPPHELGASAYRKYDIEAYLRGKGEFGEISSASNCTDYQSRRLQIRYRPQQGGEGLRFVHTLNATAAAVPRLIVALLETHAQPDGSVLIPEVLQPYMGGLQSLS